MIPLDKFLEQTPEYKNNGNKIIFYEWDGVEFYVSLDDVFMENKTDYKWSYDVIGNKLVLVSHHGSHSESISYIGDWDHQQVISNYQLC